MADEYTVRYKIRTGSEQSAAANSLIRTERPNAINQGIVRGSSTVRKNNTKAMLSNRANRDTFSDPLKKAKMPKAKPALKNSIAKPLKKDNDLIETETERNNEQSVIRKSSDARRQVEETVMQSTASFREQQKGALKRNRLKQQKTKKIATEQASKQTNKGNKNSQKNKTNDNKNQSTENGTSNSSRESPLNGSAGGSSQSASSMVQSTQAVSTSSVVSTAASTNPAGFAVKAAKFAQKKLMKKRNLYDNQSNSGGSKDFGDDAASKSDSAIKAGIGVILKKVLPNPSTAIFLAPIIGVISLIAIAGLIVMLLFAFNPSESESSGDVNIDGLSEHQAFVAKRLSEYGYSTAAIAGIMGNIQMECSFNVHLEEAGGGGGWGLIQLTGGRRTSYMSWLSRKGKKDTADSQLEYSFSKSGCELNPPGYPQWSGRPSSYQCLRNPVPLGQEYSSFEKFKKADDPVRAAWSFMVYFERCAQDYRAHWDKSDSDDDRKGWAQKFYKILSKPVASNGSNGIYGKAKQAIDYAESLFKKKVPYVYGGNNPETGLDCSSFTQWCYKKAGISIPRTADEQRNAADDRYSDISKAEPGDILWKKDHVGLYIGNGKVLEEWNTGHPVMRHDVKNDNWSEVLVFNEMRKGSKAPAFDGQFIRPCKGPISSPYGHRSLGDFHNGVDIAASSGTPYYAAAAGKVIHATNGGGYNGGAGNWVVIDHGKGYVTKYMHSSSVLVKPGDRVTQGQHIGNVGNTGRSYGPHLHFQIEKDGDAFNPADKVKF